MRSRVAAALLVAGALASLPAWSRQTPDAGSPFSGRVIEEPSPAPAGSAEPFLLVDRAGQVRLSWLEPGDGGGFRFRLSGLRGTTWSAPVTIAEGPALLANWADVPSIFTTSGGTLAAHWLERGPGRGAYGIRVATSTDDGATWSDAVTPHRDQAPAEHGFAAFFEAPGTGALGLVWLDGRLVAERGREGSMTLRSTTIARGEPGEDTVVDLRVCDCCPTAAVRTDRGVLVAYRDRGTDEVRDIAVSRLVDGRWTPPVPVARDGWRLDACPVNGPAVAAIGRAVAVAWFTLGSDATPRTRVAFSTDGGETFGAPIDVHAGVPYGRLALAMLDPDRVLVSSIERATDGAAIVVREVRRNGRTSDLVTVARTVPGRTSGFPRLVASGRRVWFAWTDVREGAPTQVRLASARMR
ncbi:MAG: sialidase family protein [Vicinamibacterales bacterium]